MARLVDTWYSVAGVAPFDDVKPVKKFSRKAAGPAGLSKDGAQRRPTRRPRCRVNDGAKWSPC
jgi:hypothetical protein